MRYAISLLGLLSSGLLLGACSERVMDVAAPSSTSAPRAITPPVSPSAPAPTPSLRLQSTAEPTLSVYRAAADCETFEVERVAVPEATLEHAVGAAIAQFQTADFPLAGYRVQAQPERQSVTIELRLPPDAPRTFDSLSLCEQFALFGGLRQTIIHFAPDQIQTVEFKVQDRAIGG
ncbi:MAG: sporulation/spore germination protein [Cyanobacteria bacterium P01_G01_bin.54]